MAEQKRSLALPSGCPSLARDVTTPFFEASLASVALPEMDLKTPPLRVAAHAERALAQAVARDGPWSPIKPRVTSPTNRPPANSPLYPWSPMPRVRVDPPFPRNVGPRVNGPPLPSWSPMDLLEATTPAGSAATTVEIKAADSAAPIRPIPRMDFLCGVGGCLPEKKDFRFPDAFVQLLPRHTNRPQFLDWYNSHLLYPDPHACQQFGFVFRAWEEQHSSTTLFNFVLSIYQAVWHETHRFHVVVILLAAYLMEKSQLDLTRPDIKPCILACEFFFLRGGCGNDARS